MGEIAEVVQEQVEESDEKGWLNTASAITVAITATFMALCNVKDNNIVQNMMAAQAAGIDEWSYFQAKSTKQNIAEASLDQVRLQREVVAATAAPELLALLDKKAVEYEGKIKRYETEKAEIKKSAEGRQKEYDRFNRRDDQFDMAEASLSVAIAIVGISVLTKRKWLFGFALAMAVAGFAFGIAGFLELNIHPDWLAKILS